MTKSLAHPETYRQVRRLVSLDSDPVFTQVKLARGQQDFRHLLDLHDAHFSFGEALGSAVPATGHTWRPTRQPVVVEAWHPAQPHRDVLTTVTNWTSDNEVTYNGCTYGQKDAEFLHFLDLPRQVAPTRLELAVNTGKTRHLPRALLAHHGWQLVNPETVCADFESYRQYIETSKAEWSVAKQGYVLGQPGWFSCRSACYLAAGRPVIVQDTGFGAVLPVGTGLLAFRTREEVVIAIREVEAYYPHHCEAARALAETYFDAKTVLSRLLADALNH